MGIKALLWILMHISGFSQQGFMDNRLKMWPHSFASQPAERWLWMWLLQADLGPLSSQLLNQHDQSHLLVISFCLLQAENRKNICIFKEKHGLEDWAGRWERQTDPVWQSMNCAWFLKDLSTRSKNTVAFLESRDPVGLFISSPCL